MKANKQFGLLTFIERNDGRGQRHEFIFEDDFSVGDFN
jgi:hypothetical protein